jgi:surface protein
MFWKCSGLTSLPNISKWNTEKVTDMSHMFCSCSLLVTLHDISNWITSNVTNMKYMFFGCSSLSSMPDISKWDTKNVTDTSYMFSYCFSLLSLPDISKWNTNKITDKSFMFFSCSELASKPDDPKIKIQTNNGKIINIDCLMSDTILVIKEKLEKLENIPAAQQRLFYEGRELEDSLTLRDYNIDEMKTILLSDNYGSNNK